MPTYVYEVLLEGEGDESENPTFELTQSPNDPPLKIHPVTGHKVRRLILPPNISSKYTKAQEDKIKDNRYLEKKGFTKYEKDKNTGKYHRVAGKEGPPVIEKPQL